MFNKNYERVNWKDYPSTDTPITAENLNVMDKGISDTQDGLVEMQQDMINELSTKADTNSICNPNLLDNGHFSVNQRGSSSYSSANTTPYCVDRWQLEWNMKVDVDSNGISIIATNAQSAIRQKIESNVWNRLVADNATVTLSIILQDGRIYSGQRNINSISPIQVADIGLLQIQNGYFRMVVGSTKAMNIRAIKLEVGSISTIANDVDNYTEELIRCQRYFYKYTLGTYACSVGSGYVADATHARVSIQLPTTMYKSPTITVNSEALSYSYLFDTSNTQKKVSSITVKEWLGDRVNLELVSSGLVTNAPCIFRCAQAGGGILFSADL